MHDKELKAWINPHLKELMNFVIPREEVKVERTKEKPKPYYTENTNDKIRPENLLLAYACYLHPDATITELYEIADLPLSTGNKRKEKAIEDGILEEFSTVIKAGRGGTAKFLTLTQKGYELLGLNPRIKARGGNEHNFWIYVVKKYYKKECYEVEIEKHIQKVNGFVDVLAEKEDEKIAIEICIQKQNITEIIHKLNSDTFTRRILCFQTDKQGQNQRAILLKDLPEGAITGFEFKPLYEFYRR